MAKKKLKDREAARQLDNQKTLNWLIREYDCYSLEELVKLAETDPVLHRIMRECGHRF